MNDGAFASFAGVLSDRCSDADAQLPCKGWNTRRRSDRTASTTASSTAVAVSSRGRNFSPRTSRSCAVISFQSHPCLCNSSRIEQAVSSSPLATRAMAEQTSTTGLLGNKSRYRSAAQRTSEYSRRSTACRMKPARASAMAPCEPFRMNLKFYARGSPHGESVSRILLARSELQLKGRASRRGFREPVTFRAWVLKVDLPAEVFLDGRRPRSGVSSPRAHSASSVA